MSTTNRISSERRRFIYLLAGGSVLLFPLLSGCTKKGNSSIPGLGKSTFSNSDPRYRWLSVAARAPSSHNMQPWKVEITSRPDMLLLYVDTRKLLPEADPRQRQTMISLGGFLELLCMAAGADGVHCEVKLFAKGEDKNQPVAQVFFSNMERPTTPDGLLPFVKQRRVNRDEYNKDKPLAPQQLSILLVEGTSNDVITCGSVQSRQVSAVSALAIEAWLAELQHQGIMQEMLNVTRIGSNEIERYRDGIAIQGFLPELAATMGMFPRDHVPASDSAMMNSMRKMGRKQADSAAGWVWIVTPGNTRTQQLAAGRSFVRLHLRATQLGLALQPMSQLLEYSPAMVELQRSLYRTLDVSSDKATIQMLARVGYADSVPPTPRRDISEFLVQKES